MIFYEYVNTQHFKKIIVLFIAILFLSCNSSHLLRVSIVGTSENANVLYKVGNINTEEDKALPWSKDLFIYSGEELNLYVLNRDKNSEIDVRVFFIDNGNWRTLKREVSESHVIIQERIY
jgi:hypothetical protein